MNFSGKGAPPDSSLAGLKQWRNDMDHSKFFTALRRREIRVFGTSLSKAQVEGINLILAECSRMGADLGQTAYILATGYGETGGRMQPVRENMNYSAKSVAKHFGAHRRQGKTPAQLARNPKILANTVYGGEWGLKNLGNRIGTDDGWNFRGALTSQMTGLRNFNKFGNRLGVDFIGNPELLNDPVMGARSLVQPMLEGWATKHKLSTFVSGEKRDYLGARKVWGGVDAGKYVGHAKAFDSALIAGGMSVSGDKSEPVRTAPQQPAAPIPDHVPVVAAKPAGGFFAALMALFGGRT
jgi:putative chitinase